MSRQDAEGEPQRLRAIVRGAVQGVGFRPFVYRLATELELTGWVINDARGVTLEVEGRGAQLDAFLDGLTRDAPVRAVVQGSEHWFLDAVGFQRFEIRETESVGAKTVLVLPDVGTCRDCLREIFDPLDRRHRYPFTNCTNCGPRYSIIRSLPYDRQNTTMAGFQMCTTCRVEYEDPRDRRFHAQPNACAECGPELALLDSSGNSMTGGDDALRDATAALRRGAILAVKGLGGFHLMVDAGDGRAVERLRERKLREEKPLAVMFPSLTHVLETCHADDRERDLLQSPEAPIVLLRKRSGSRAIAAPVAPGNPCLGVMLPYTPLHHLLLHDLGFPVVATSGNLSDEPICIDETDASARLQGISDYLLVHDRPIARHVDDSVVRVVAGRILVLRRARGFAPLPIPLEPALAPATPVLAVGGHLKNSVSLATHGQVFLSQHIGDLDTEASRDAHQKAIDDLQSLYESPAERVAADMHPDYASTLSATASGRELTRVQHHHAHVLSCMAENGLSGRVLGIAWDGAGYGTDGSIWGGEFLSVSGARFERLGHLRTFRIPGGDQAAREPRRAALGVLYELLGRTVFEQEHLHCVRTFSPGDRVALGSMLERDAGCYLTSSIGRLFDAISSICGLRQFASFEGQAAMELEFAADPLEPGSGGAFELSRRADGTIILDWGPFVTELLDRPQGDLDRAHAAARFHDSLVQGIVDVARRAGIARVVLSGGCFQNRRLLEGAVKRLRDAGFKPYWHQRVPPNDGGLALGQALAVLADHGEGD